MQSGGGRWVLRVFAPGCASRPREGERAASEVAHHARPLAARWRGWNEASAGGARTGAQAALPCGASQGVASRFVLLDLHPHALVAYRQPHVSCQIPCSLMPMMCTASNHRPRFLNSFLLHILPLYFDGSAVVDLQPRSATWPSSSLQHASGE